MLKRFGGSVLFALAVCLCIIAQDIISISHDWGGGGLALGQMM